MRTLINHFKLSKVDTLFVNSSMRWAWSLVFFESSVILLSVYIVAVSRLSFWIAKDSIASKAFTIASCSAWLFEHLLFVWVLFGLRVPYRWILPLPTQLLVHFCSHLCMYAWIICSSCPIASAIWQLLPGVASSWVPFRCRLIVLGLPSLF